MDELEILRRRVERLDHDLLAYGQHLESCASNFVLIPKSGWRPAIRRPCSCGFHAAIRFKTEGRWPEATQEP